LALFFDRFLRFFRAVSDSHELEVSSSSSEPESLTLQLSEDNVDSEVVSSSGVDNDLWLFFLESRFRPVTSDSFPECFLHAILTEAFSVTDTDGFASVLAPLLSIEGSTSCLVSNPALLVALGSAIVADCVAWASLIWGGFRSGASEGGVVEWVNGPEPGSVGVSGTEINDGELVELGTTLGSVDIRSNRRAVAICLYSTISTIEEEKGTVSN
jgi:hypothetical protein